VIAISRRGILELLASGDASATRKGSLPGKSLLFSSGNYGVVFTMISSCGLVTVVLTSWN